MSMKTNAILSAIAAALCLSATGVEATGVVSKNTFSGRATVVKTNVLGINITAADTGELKSTGGSIDKSMDAISILGVLETGLLTAKTSGKGSTAGSFAELADIDLNVAGLINVYGNVINAHTKATCSSTKKASVSGGSRIAFLEINGMPIEVTGAPNQTISLHHLPLLPIVGNLVKSLPLLGGLPLVGGLLDNGNGLPLVGGLLDGVDQVVTLVINEQQKTQPTSTKAEIKVNAIHLTVKAPVLGLTLADVVISHAKSGITCRS